MEFSLNRLILALANTLDLVGLDDVGHGKRVALMAKAIGVQLGLSEERQITVLRAGLLHDCGVSSTSVHNHLVQEIEWEHAEVHCRIGEDLLNSFTPFAPLAPIIRYHHTPYQKLHALALDPSTKQAANLIFLADRVDMLTTRYRLSEDILNSYEGIKQRVVDLSDELFAPELTSAFLAAAASDAFWLAQQPSHLENFINDELESKITQPLNLPDLKVLAHVFARIVDAKSPFTLEHSFGVAQVARRLAEKIKLTAETRDKLEIAGMLHDIGKLRVPDEILEKPGPLTAAETLIMRGHSFETYEILRRIPGFSDIAKWAGYHHETPNQDGYPFRLDAKEIGIESRIVAVADVFQALAQDRPYRPGMSLNKILMILHQYAEEGLLDARLVGLVVDDAEQFLQIASSPDLPDWATHSYEAAV